MCGVIVVDAGRSRSTCHGRDAYIGFTSGFSQDSIIITVGEQITVKQLVEKCIVMRISRHDHVYRHHARGK